jgi:hypothetical protein
MSTGKRISLIAISRPPKSLETAFFSPSGYSDSGTANPRTML